MTSLDADLRDLVARGLVHHDVKEKRFDLHPIVRRYAYDRLAAPDRAAVHTRLRDYFAAVPEPNKVTRLEDLAPVIELYHHTVRAGQLDEAFTLYCDRLSNPLYYQLGAYQLIIDLLRALFPDGEDRLPHLKDESDQAWTLNELANSYSLSGQSRRAVPLLEQASDICENRTLNKQHLAIVLGSIGQFQIPIGELRAAEANLRRYIALSRELGIEEENADAYRELGRLLACRGADAESETELATALRIFEKQNYMHGQGVNYAHRTLRELLRLRIVSSSFPGSAWECTGSQAPPAEQGSGGRTSEALGSQAEPGNQVAAPLVPARRALELADETARTMYPVERDYVRAHWLLGAALRVAGQPDEAERHLHEALQRCRRINMVDHEADILIDLARLRAATGAADEALRLAEEARVIAERSGYVLQGADAHLELARLALDRGDKATAKEHAEQAHRLATCDGPPDFTYHAADTESATLLAQLGSG